MECNKRYYNFNSCVFFLCSHLYKWRLGRGRGLCRTIVTIT